MASEGLWTLSVLLLLLALFGCSQAAGEAPSPLKWPVLRRTYTLNSTASSSGEGGRQDPGASSLNNYLLVVYDVISNSHLSNLDAFLRYMEVFPRFQRAASASTDHKMNLKFMFLFKATTSAQIYARRDQFCSIPGTQCITHIKQQSEREDPGLERSVVHPDVRLMTSPSWSMDWKEFFSLFQHLPSDISPVLLVRSNTIGPILPFYAHFSAHNPFNSFLQYLTEDTPVVLADAHINYHYRKATLTLLNGHSPILFSRSILLALSQQPRMNRRWLMSVLASGWNIRILNPRYAHIDWLRYYNLCWLREDVQLDQCKTLHNVIMNDPHSEFNDKRVQDLMQVMASGSNHSLPSSPSHTPPSTTLDSALWTRNFQTHVSLFQDIDQLSSELEYNNSFLFPMHSTLRSMHEYAARFPSPATPLPPLGKTLVIYLFKESSDDISNFLAFQKHGMLPSNLLDIYILVLGSSTLRMPSQFNVQVRRFPSWECREISAWGMVISDLHKSNELQRYKNFVVLSSHVRGPYLPPSWNFAQHLWTEALTSHLDDKIKLVGLSVACPDVMGRKYVHLQSGLWAFDHSTIDIWIKHEQQVRANQAVTEGALKDVAAALDAALRRPTGAHHQHEANARVVPLGSHASGASARSAGASDSSLSDLASFFQCANSRQQALQKESELSESILKAGFDILSMQPYFAEVSWQARYKAILAAPLIHVFDNRPTCQDVSLNVFHGSRWNIGDTNPHPYDFVFIQTTHKIYGGDLKKMDFLFTEARALPIPQDPRLYSAPADMPIHLHPYNTLYLDTMHDWKHNGAQSLNASVSPHDPHSLRNLNPQNYYLTPANLHYHPSTGLAKQCVFFTHNLNLEGAPLWLVRIVPLFVQAGYNVKIFSLMAGTLTEHYRNIGVEVMVFEESHPFVMSGDIPVFEQWMEYFHEQAVIRYAFSPSLFLFNTVLFTRSVSALPLFRTPTKRAIWVVHEAELYEVIKEPKGYFYARDLPELAKMSSAYFVADTLLFVSDSGREYPSVFDFGQFATIHGFVEDKACDVEGNAAFGGLTPAEAKHKMRASLSIPDDAIVISSIGTICDRKQQHWLVDLLDTSGVKDVDGRPIYILLIGYENNPNLPYEKELVQRITNTGLNNRILVIPKTTKPLAYAAAVDVHTSLSTHESFPLNTLEVMCLGIPLLATPAYGIREQILFPGKDGILLPDVHAYNSLAPQLKALFSLPNGSAAASGSVMPWVEMGQQGRHTVQNLFTATSIKPYFAQLLSTMVPQPPPNPHRVCIVMRVDPQHVKLEKTGEKEERTPLERAMQSIYDQEHENWELLLVPTEPMDMTLMFSLVVRYNHYEQHDTSQDPAAEQASEARSARIRRIFNQIRIVNYHYGIRPSAPGSAQNSHAQQRHQHTDQAIQQCSSDSRWLLLTRANVHYEPTILNHLDSRFDMLTFDYTLSEESRPSTPTAAMEHCANYLHAPDRLAAPGASHGQTKQSQGEAGKMRAASLAYATQQSFAQQSARTKQGLACRSHQAFTPSARLSATLLDLKLWLNERFQVASVAENAAEDEVLAALSKAELRWRVKHVGWEERPDATCLVHQDWNYNTCVVRDETRYWIESQQKCISEQDLASWKNRLKDAIKESSLYHCVVVTA